MKPKQKTSQTLLSTNKHHLAADYFSASRDPANIVVKMEWATIEGEDFNGTS